MADKTESNLTNKERYLINNFKLDENTVRAISEIGRLVGTKKFNVWIAKEIKKKPELIHNAKDFQYIVDWSTKISPDINELSFQQAFDLSTEWHKSIKYDEKAKNKEVEDDGNVLYRCRDKKHLFVLLGPEDLKQEGKVMHNCVGDYTEKVRNNRSLIISLRDDKNESHVTVEIDTKTGMSLQVRGKANGDPAPKYQRLITEFAIFSSGYGDVMDKELMDLMKLNFE